MKETGNSLGNTVPDQNAEADNPEVMSYSPEQAETTCHDA